uniref:Uncharacterized protein n=1 Tax=Panagrolaimus superbus TaxID=310955 RepID=A0A914XXY3_9BILA
MEEDTVLVSDRNNAENDFKCYAKIMSEPLQRSKLINHSNEKTAEKSENERKWDSFAQKVNPIDEEIAKEKYQELTQSILNESIQKQQEEETEYEEVIEINRLYESYDFDFEEEEEYLPKLKYEPQTITSEDINSEFDIKRLL